MDVPPPSGPEVTWAELLRYYLGRAGLARQALADRAQINVRTVAFWLSGKTRTVNSKVATAVLEALRDPAQLSPVEQTHLLKVARQGVGEWPPASAEPEEGPEPKPIERKARPRTLILVGLALLLAVGAVYLWWPKTSGPAESAGPVEVLFRDDFHHAGRGWPVGPQPDGIEEFVAGAYRISAKPGYAVWSPAPEVRPAVATRIVATARLAKGNGGWGVWCRGATTGERYEFSVTHAAAAYIKTPGWAMPPVSMANFDAYRDNRVEAVCRDTRGGIELTLTVNGVRVASHLDRGPLLGPGQAGVHAFTFADVIGDPADVRFTYFEVDRLPR
jgi:hypothetical protein